MASAPSSPRLVRAHTYSITSYNWSYLSDAFNTTQARESTFRGPSTAILSPMLSTRSEPALTEACSTPST